MTWAHSQVLQGLWLALPVGLLLWFGTRRRLRSMGAITDETMLPRLVNPLRLRLPHVENGLWLAAVVLLVLALARPQWGHTLLEAKQRGVDVVVALDTSRSMLAEDFKPSRLDQAKWGLRELLRELQGDRIALLPFAGTSFLQCPLTADYSAVRMTLDDTRVGIIPRGGTDIGEAVHNALDAFDADSRADRVLLLVTDGENHEGDPRQWMGRLREAGIRVFAIGVGSLEGDLIPLEGGVRDGAFLKDREGRVVKSALQEDLLEELCVGTEGLYVRARPGDLGIDRLLRQGLDRLNRAHHQSKIVVRRRERFAWFVWFALAALLLETAAGYVRREDRKHA